MTKIDYNLWLPTTKKEVELRGWKELDVILFSGDAYIDHPSFGTAVIGRIIESMGLRVAIIPQPNWRDDLRDFKKLGKPNLYFGISPGCMDSMVNRYTANRRLRSEDAYTPDGRHDMRPDYPTIVYSQILRKIYPDTPIVLGGIEASLRRLTHYDYWQEKLRHSILLDSHADILLYGMGEITVREITKSFQRGDSWEQIHHQMSQISYIAPKKVEPLNGDILLHSHEDCLRNKKFLAENFKHIEIESNRIEASRILQYVGNQTVVVNPPYPPMSTEILDSSFDLPYTRLPHPKYKNKRIPAYEMIKDSINLHRGCFGGCSFCTISAHQGKFIVSRSKENILREVKKVTQMPNFKGYISDLGGPSANMYKMKGKDIEICKKCKRPSCVYPKVCLNLNTDHTPILEIFHEVDKIPGIKKSFVSSGVRYDLLLNKSGDSKIDQSKKQYTEELIRNHVSGRLKVAPEHTSNKVLSFVRKPPFEQFIEFTKIFHHINEEAGLKQQLIPYFISSLPSCEEEDMAKLAIETKNLHFQLEQIQDFTPTPMTLATVAWYSGVHPYSLEKLYCAKTPNQKLAQRQFFFWYKPEKRKEISLALRKIGREDLLQKLYSHQNSKRQGEKKNNEEKKYLNKKDKKSSLDNKKSKYNRGNHSIREPNTSSKKKSYNPNFK